jgi:lysyl-tRNA synthetase, class II
MTAENKLIKQRRDKLQSLRGEKKAFINNFKPKNKISDIISLYDSKDKVQLADLGIRVSLAGRIMTTRMMGKAAFVSLQDDTGTIQLYIQKDNIGEDNYNRFKNDDIGDIVGIKGEVFKTNKQELSVRVSFYSLLSKALRPLPEKFHGLTDTEARYRMRYVDLIINDKSRKIFKNRFKIIEEMRNFFKEENFYEVETPMMHVLAGGATARAFQTYHNAYDMPLYMRIAPELFLKRLIVGGFERVYEINRSFRNEGVSTKHNPEFTMIEFYQAYATYQDLMDLTENLLRKLTYIIHDKLQFRSNNIDYDFEKPFERMTLIDAIKKHNPNLKNVKDFDELLAYCETIDIKVEENWGVGKLQLEIFEKTVEDKLILPTFITEYPTEVSPLARKNDQDPNITDRFEFFVGGVEIANGFSELNDPEDQAKRFKKQVANKEKGDMEAMSFDEDYIKALEYAMPPTAGEGIGIDRLVMLLCDRQSIKDVILFPHMKPLNQNK